jgi:hypothetical protein
MEYFTVDKPNKPRKFRFEPCGEPRATDLIWPFVVDADSHPGFAELALFDFDRLVAMDPGAADTAALEACMNVRRRYPDAKFGLVVWGPLLDFWSRTRQYLQKQGYELIMPLDIERWAMAMAESIAELQASVN